MLWGIITQTNVDHAELLWEEYTHGIQTFFSHKASHKTSLKDPKKKVTPLLIPYGRFSKVIIYYLASNNNIHRRPDSAVHHTGDDFILGNLKFVPKSETDEVLRRLVWKRIRKVRRKVDYVDMKRAIKLSLDPAFLPQGQAPVGGVTIRDPVSETTPKLPNVVGKGKAIVTEEQVAHSLIDLSKKKRLPDQYLLFKILVRRDQAPHESTTGPSSQPEDDTSEKVIHESSSTSDSERTESETETAAPKGDKDQGEVDSSTVTSGASIPVSVPEKAHEALAGPDPEPMQEDQTGSNSGKLHKVILFNVFHENLYDTYNFGDQFLYDKPTEDDQEKSKVIEESDSTIPDPSHQTVTSTPPVIAPFTDVSSFSEGLRDHSCMTTRRPKQTSFGIRSFITTIPPTSALHQKQFSHEMDKSRHCANQFQDLRLLDAPGYIIQDSCNLIFSNTICPPSKKDMRSFCNHVIMRPVPHHMAPDHSSSGLVLYEMTSDQIRSDLTPNRQETSVDNISSDLILNKQKASDYDISGPYKTLLSLPHAILIMKICIHFNQQSHEYQWTKDHPLEQVIDNPTNPVQTRQQLATDPEMCMFALTVSTEEPKNSKEAMADSA
ncbi:hypothetical protein Tco_0412350 [Tanacetum coccineum]